MPKDEFDFDDPMELNGVGLVGAEDTTDAMTECFVEEFLRLGHNAKQILAMFRNPHYIGMNMALEKRGEQFVRDTISEVFARWGRVITWSGERRAYIPVREFTVPSSPVLQAANANSPPCILATGTSPEPADKNVCSTSPAPEQAIALDEIHTDPMGIPIPKLNI